MRQPFVPPAGAVFSADSATPDHERTELDHQAPQRLYLMQVGSYAGI